MSDHFKDQHNKQSCNRQHVWVFSKPSHCDFRKKKAQLIVFSALFLTPDVLISVSLLKHLKEPQVIWDLPLTLELTKNVTGSLHHHTFTGPSRGKQSSSSQRSTEPF